MKNILIRKLKELYPSFDENKLISLNELESKINIERDDLLKNLLQLKEENLIDIDDGLTMNIKLNPGLYEND